MALVCASTVVSSAPVPPGLLSKALEVKNWVKAGGVDSVATLTIDGERVMSWNSTCGTGASFQKPMPLTKGQKYDLELHFSQGDSTGTHPAIALQWNLMGASPLEDATRAVEAADAAILVVGGGTSVTSGEGVDRASLALPGRQLDFAKRVQRAALAASTKLVVVVVDGKPLAEPWIKASMPAILHTWFGGQAAGVATAEAVLGRFNPAGRVPLSFPVSADVLPVYYDRKPSAKRGGYHDPPIIPGGLYPPSSQTDDSLLWAFGHGLSYGATFQSLPGASRLPSFGPQRATRVAKRAASSRNTLGTAPSPSTRRSRPRTGPRPSFSESRTTGPEPATRSPCSSSETTSRP